VSWARQAEGLTRLQSQPTRKSESENNTSLLISSKKNKDETRASEVSTHLLEPFEVRQKITRINKYRNRKFLLTTLTRLATDRISDVSRLKTKVKIT
jgi:hypothetical protein